MPRASKMTDEEKVFYWADTGPVEYWVRGNQIVRANGVEDGMCLYTWEAGKGSIWLGETENRGE